MGNYLIQPGSNRQNFENGGILPFTLDSIPDHAYLLKERYEYDTVLNTSSVLDGTNDDRDSVTQSTVSTSSETDLASNENTRTSGLLEKISPIPNINTVKVLKRRLQRMEP